METPFIFGRLAEGIFFTNREDETKRLVDNFRTGSHTVLISPRRWGKSSLVSKAAHVTRIQEKKIRIASIDLFSTRTEHQFYELLAREILKCTSGKWEEVMDNAKEFLGRLVPNLSFSPGKQEHFDLSLNWKEVERNPDDILDLAEKIASRKKIRVVVCIDEFQNIKAFGDPLALQKKLRAHWQKHQLVSYCLYGSKRNMMTEVFASPDMPFYKFGEIMMLQKIKEVDWIPFLLKRFSATGKKISREQAGHLIQSVDCHPYYVQQLAQQAWLRTGKSCTMEIIDEARESILFQLSLLFQNMTDTLTSPQINFLHALLDGVPQFSAQQVLHDYALGTSANILRIKEALVAKEILDISGSRIEFLDPFYRMWLEQLYFAPRKPG